MAVTHMLPLFNRQGNHDKVYCVVINIMLGSGSYDDDGRWVNDDLTFEVFGYFGRRSVYDARGYQRLTRSPAQTFTTLIAARTAFIQLAESKIAKGYTRFVDGVTRDSSIGIVSQDYETAEGRSLRLQQGQLIPKTKKRIENTKPKSSGLVPPVQTFSRRKRLIEV